MKKSSLKGVSQLKIIVRFRNQAEKHQNINFPCGLVYILTIRYFVKALEG